MKPTEQSLREQLRIFDYEIERRLRLLHVSAEERALLLELKPQVAEDIDGLVEEFYAQQVAHDEIAQVIGDSETLARLKNHLRGYILNLFEGQYDAEYVQTRLRIGMVHNRIGVAPKLYVAAFKLLLAILSKRIVGLGGRNCDSCFKCLDALEKILFFDLTLVFDTYIHSLVMELNRSKLEVEEYVTSLEGIVSQRTQELQELARKDGLTGLLNQRSLFEELRRELARSKRRSYPLSLVYVDLDKFKSVNDTLGHKYGDSILVAAAESFRAVLRPEDVAARYGGDEFCVVLPQTEVEDAVIVAQRVIEHFDSIKPECNVTLSIGIAMSPPESGLDADILVKMADTAMYLSKKESGHQVNTFDGTVMDEDAERASSREG